jgi:hypothetical protein
MVDSSEGMEEVMLMMNGFVEFGCARKMSRIQARYVESGCGL